MEIKLRNVFRTAALCVVIFAIALSACEEDNSDDAFIVNYFDKNVSSSSKAMDTFSVDLDNDGTMDGAYEYYKTCTGREPTPFAPTYINNHTAIADATTTCGAGCGYLGFTGIEMQNVYFDANYNVINNNNQVDHLGFYEFGRNFWFYGAKLDYKENGSFPIAGAYAVFMSHMARDATGINPAPFAGMTYEQIVAQLRGLIDIYLANPSLNWSNTLAVDQGVPGTNTNAAGLFCSFMYRLRRDYGGENFIQNVWKQAGLRPNATTTQDAVDNFFLASCAAANKNLTAVFQSWRWPLSANAITAASRYP